MNKKQYLKKGAILLISIGLLVGASFSTAANRRGRTTYIHVYPGPGTPLQNGIDQANDGDVVIVHEGTYYEHQIEIDNSIIVSGVNRYTTIIDGGGVGDVVYISADSVNINGFTIQNCGYPHAGIDIRSDYNVINDNFISNNWYGIYLEFCSNNNIFNNNICFQTGTGIRADYTSNNTISRNNVSSNEGLGIRFKFEGTYNIVSENIISSNIEENIGVSNQSCYNTISNNRISSSDCSGLDIYQQSCHNIISNNSISSHNSRGISIRYLSNDNIICHNNLINNSQNAYDECTNNWDNGYPSGGNYWYDYTGTDSNGDGIGDTPYDIPGSNQDNYPLIVPYGENPPVANFSYSANDLTIYCNGSSSYDRDGEIISYKWSFGDGTNGSGMIVRHMYPDNGTYTVTLNITDNHNLTDNISQSVTVMDESPPQISNLQAVPPIQSPGGYVNISAQVTDGGGLADVCLIIRCPDNSVENISILDNKTGDTYYYNRTFDMIGFYFGCIWAVDISGNSATSNLRLFVITEEFICDAGELYSGWVDEPLQFNGYAVGGVPPYSWHWDFGDGNTSDIQNPIYTYTNVENYTVTLTVTDDESNTVDDTTWALIQKVNEPPGAPTIDGPPHGKVGVEYCWTFHSEDPDGDNIKYIINWGDGETTETDCYPSCTPVEVCHTYSDQGTYDIKAKAKECTQECLESEWSDPLSVTMPRNRILINVLFLRLLERFPNLFPILQQILQRLELQN